MSFELAYDLNIEVDREVVFIKSDDWHRKVRILIQSCDTSGDQITFVGHSLGSSFQPIKAAKREEPPVVVKGDFTLQSGKWVGTLTGA